jgi:hypothetical protein
MLTLSSTSWCPEDLHKNMISFSVILGYIWLSLIKQNETWNKHILCSDVEFLVFENRFLLNNRLVLFIFYNITNMIDWFLNAAFSNISAISWRPVLVVEGAECTLFSSPDPKGHEDLLKKCRVVRSCCADHFYPVRFLILLMVFELLPKTCNFTVCSIFSNRETR